MAYDATRVSKRRSRALLGGMALLVAMSFTAPAYADVIFPPRSAPAADLQVTYVARVCDDYIDVMANKARNNLQESLRDLGPDTTYPPNGVVNAAAEAAGSPNCRPLADWRFTLGTGIAGRSSATLDLSTVTGAFGTDIVTQASTPELDANGNDTGRTLQGAVTVPLTAAQADLVRSGRTLWVQGGTPTEPLNGQQTTYGYAALRCAQDAVNGDNVEYLSYPSRQSHVFCYYYAVSPPPLPGTIIVNKQLAEGTVGAATFRYDGNISYADTNGDGVNDFLLSPTAGTPASETFYRGAVSAADPPWEFSEVQADGWQSSGPPVCTSELGSPITITGTAVSVRLLGTDTVTCTFTNERATTGPGTLSKLTQGAGGTFPFTIDAPEGGTDRSETATTAGDGDQVVVADTVAAVPGEYTVTETLPEPTPAGSWELATAECDGESIPVSAQGQDRTGTWTLEAGQQFNCLVVNQYIPGGSLAIRKSTTPVPGTARFEVNPVAADGGPVLAVESPSFVANAETTEAGTFTEAVWEGEVPDQLHVEPAAVYSIQEILPAPSEDGFWVLEDADCGPNAYTVDTAAASVLVTLTAENPDAVCDFSNAFIEFGAARVIKTTTADPVLRPGATVVTITCTPETEYTFEVPAGQSTFDSGEATVTGREECRVQEPDTGAAAGVEVTTSATLSIDGGAPTALEPFDAPFVVDVGRSVVVTVDNAYAAPTPTPTPTPSPTGPPTPVDPGGGLASTGATGTPLGLLFAAIPLALGLGLVLAARRSGTRRIR